MTWPFRISKSTVCKVLLVFVLVGIACALPMELVLADTHEASLPARVAEWIAKMILIILIMIATLLLALSGLLLNESIELTVFQFGNYARLPGINTAWEAFRDLANIGLVFVFLYLAITIVLGIQAQGSRKLLATAIIVALLLNFSLFFARLVPDVANRAGIVFFNAITVEQKTNIGPGNTEKLLRTTDTNSATDIGTAPTDLKARQEHQVSGLSGAFMHLLGITGALDFSGINSAITGTGPIGTGRQVAAGVGIALLFFTLAGVFFTATLLFVSRMVVLLFLMIVSALAFLAYALPNTSGYARRWLQMLINQSLIAPVFLGLLWVTAHLLQQFIALTKNTTGTGGSVGKAAVDFSLKGGNALSSANVILTFLIATALIIVSIRMSKQLAGEGGSMAMKAGGWALNRAARRGAIMTRDSAGRGFRAVNQGAAGNWARKQALRGSEAPIMSRIGKALDRTLEGGQNAKFDVRGSKLGRAALGAISDKGMIKGPIKRGYQDKYEANQKAAKETEERRIAQVANYEAGSAQARTIQRQQEGQKERLENQLKAFKQVGERADARIKNLQAKEATGSLSQAERAQLQAQQRTRTQAKKNAEQVEKRLNDLKETIKKGDVKARTKEIRKELTEKRAQIIERTPTGMGTPQSFNHDLANALRVSVGQEKTDNVKMLEALKELKGELKKGNEKE